VIEQHTGVVVHNEYAGINNRLHGVMLEQGEGKVTGRSVKPAV
jgi:hypothetical protein